MNSCILFELLILKDLFLHSLLYFNFKTLENIQNKQDSSHQEYFIVGKFLSKYEMVTHFYIEKLTFKVTCEVF